MRGPGRDPARTIEMVRMYRMIEELSLTEEQCEKIFPIMNQMNKRQREIREDGEKLFMELRRLVRDDNVMEPELASRIEALHALQMKQRASEDELFESLKPHLSVKQQAQLLLFQQDFHAMINDLVDRVRQQHRPMPPDMHNPDQRRLREHRERNREPVRPEDPPKEEG